MNLMDLFYPPFTPPNIPGRVHLLKDDPPSKNSVLMTQRWADPAKKAKAFPSPKKDAIVSAFSGKVWNTVAQVSNKTKIDMPYVQKIAVTLHREGKLERRYAKDCMTRCYEYRKVSNAS